MAAIHVLSVTPRRIDDTATLAARSPDCFGGFAEHDARKALKGTAVVATNDTATPRSPTAARTVVIPKELRAVHAELPNGHAEDHDHQNGDDAQSCTHFVDITEE